MSELTKILKEIRQRNDAEYTQSVLGLLVILKAQTPTISKHGSVVSLDFDQFKDAEIVFECLGKITGVDS